MKKCVTTESVIVGVQFMIKKGTDKHINKIPGDMDDIIFFTKMKKIGNSNNWSENIQSGQKDGI